MRQQTISKWKRDALEILWDYKNPIDAREKHAVKQARRVMILVDELRSERIMHPKKNGKLPETSMSDGRR